jgi:hypothetical protein
VRTHPHGRPLGPWYVPRALGERGTSALRTSLGRVRGGIAIFTVAGGLVVALASCGSDESSRQDAGEPQGKFPVDVYRSQFANRQRLAQTTDLVLGVQNTGDEPIPDLAITISTDGGQTTGSYNTGGSFYIRIDDPSLANPNRPVWILEDKYPKIKGEGLPPGSSVGTAAQTNTYAFGELEPGDRREMIWRLTPVRAGTYTVDYEVSAGLYGNAEAETADGSTPEGKFVVTISDKPPEARVNEAGQVETTG